MAWAPNYVTVEDAKEYIRVADTVDDTQIALAVTAASRAVDDHCRRQFGKVDAAAQRLYTAHYDRHRRRWSVAIDDLMDNTGLTVTVDGVATTAYRLDDPNAPADGLPWTELTFTGSPYPRPRFGYLDQIGAQVGEDYGVAVTASWGWTAVPDQVVEATLMQANRFVMRRFSPYGTAGTPQDGSQIRLLSKLDPDVITALGTRLVRY